jgi:hypothetical protein
MSRCSVAPLALASLVCFPMACAAPVPTVPSDARVAGAAPLDAAGAAHAAHASHAVPNGAAQPEALSAEVNQQIARLRAFLAPFHNFDKAVEFGYSVPVPGEGVCISDPERGGMGYHYTLANKDLVGDGVVNLLEPEFLVYSPKPNGGVRLSAVDYFVPYDTWPYAEPPSLLGVPFQREDAFGAYVMHIWAFWPNPAGIFENFNPDVPLCPQ